VSVGIAASGSPAAICSKGGAGIVKRACVRATEGIPMSERKVDIPITVPKETAKEMADDLEETGRISIEVTEGNAPSLAEQIRSQLDNNQQLLEFTEDYDAE